MALKAPEIRRGRPKRLGPAKALSGRGGFTLLETVLTMAIVVGLLGVLLAAIRITLRSWETGEERISGVAARNALAQRLSEDASSMKSYAVREDLSTKSVFRGGPDRLVFATVAHSGGFDLPWGGVTRVDYRLEKEGLVIVERTLPEAESSPERAIEIGPGIKSVRFEYLGPDGWLEAWDADSKDSLPRAVRANLAPGRGESYSVTAIVRASESGRAGRKGIDERKGGND